MTLARKCLDSVSCSLVALATTHPAGLAEISTVRSCTWKETAVKITTKNADGTPGAVIEVADEEVVAAGFMPSAKFQEELNRRGISIATKAGYKKPEELTPEEIKALAEQKGVKLDAEAASPSDTAVAIETAVKKNRTQWETAELTPLQQKLKEQEEENDRLLASQLYSQIIAVAAAAGVDDVLLKAPTKNMQPPIVSMLADAFSYDLDTKQFLVTSDDGEGFAFSDKPSEAHPYKDVEEFVTSWAEDKANAKFIKAGQRGPNLQGTVAGGGRAGAGPVHLSRADSRNARMVQAAVAEAVRRGLDPHNGGVVYDS